jgi:hypothetical protein
MAFLADNKIGEWPGYLRNGVSGADATIEVSDAEMLTILKKTCSELSHNTPLHFVYPTVLYTLANGRPINTPVLFVAAHQAFGENHYHSFHWDGHGDAEFRDHVGELVTITKFNRMSNLRKQDKTDSRPKAEVRKGKFEASAGGSKKRGDDGDDGA